MTEPEDVSGLPALLAEGVQEEDPWLVDDTLYRPAPPRTRSARVQAIPYFAWGNGGRSTMAVWLREG